MHPLKATKDIQQDDKKLAQKINKRSGTELSQTGPRLSLFIVVVKDNYAEINIQIFLSHLAQTFTHSIVTLGKNWILSKDLIN